MKDADDEYLYIKWTALSQLHTYQCMYYKKISFEKLENYKSRELWHVDIIRRLYQNQIYSPNLYIYKMNVEFVIPSWFATIIKNTHSNSDDWLHKQRIPPTPLGSYICILHEFQAQKILSQHL